MRIGHVLYAFARHQFAIDGGEVQARRAGQHHNDGNGCTPHDFGSAQNSIAARESNGCCIIPPALFACLTLSLNLSIDKACGLTPCAPAIETGVDLT
jgi:hypothetical protein